MAADGYVRVAAVADVAAGASKAVIAAGRPVLLCNSLDRIFAVENRCSHAEQALDCGRVRLGWVACPAHGARFDLETGEPLGPPASDPIRTYPVRIVDDWIEVDVR